MIRYTLHNTQAKTIGGVGSLLVLLSFVPTVGGVFGLIGFVMVLIAIKYISDELRERKIFNDMLIAVVLAIIGIAFGSLVVMGTVLNAFANGYFSTAMVPSSSVTMAQWIAFGTSLALGLFAAWVFLIASAVFIRRSYKIIGARLNVDTFGTAGTLYLIGAATAVVGVGFVILLVAQILTAVAFFSIREEPPITDTTRMQTPPPTTR